MLDTGLLATGVAIVLVIYVSSQLAPVSAFDPDDVLDRLIAPAIGGLLAGRAVATLLDDPQSFRTVRSFLVIRGGVEFWPGVLAMVALLAIGIRRRGGSVSVGLAELAPFALWGYATFEATCLLPRRLLWAGQRDRPDAERPPNSDASNRRACRACRGGARGDHQSAIGGDPGNEPAARRGRSRPRALDCLDLAAADR